MHLTISTTVAFEAAHRQLNDPSKCGVLHGHNWEVIIEITGEPNSLGYVIDFKDIHELIQIKYDHKVLLCTDDPLIEILRAHQQLVQILPVNPTCENLVREIGTILQARILYNSKWESLKVRVQENTRSYAEEIFIPEWRSNETK